MLCDKWVIDEFILNLLGDRIVNGNFKDAFHLDTRKNNAKSEGLGFREAKTNYPSCLASPKNREKDIIY